MMPLLHSAEGLNKRKQVLLDLKQTTSGLFAMLTDTPSRVCITSVVALLDGGGGDAHTLRTRGSLLGARAGLGLSRVASREIELHEARGSGPCWWKKGNANSPHVTRV